ncbi:hypothetical protein H310_12898 [Aphanomyces invadans]|uniref:EF-hand domain-containing protein n=1 Tax=Aphanomyces invadans TaxID=157072 RepID=A0A024TFD7_9STRA|nr:hypothetical protein H310_12898 [Aphanomyces invadans]ETV92860.1 hypothetical protein H310_12898 [Aphanomyces invadans]|eukprot:XP_008878382.1 hypothetical protein H310_12898 [Aphanomyces invadans]
MLHTLRLRPGIALGRTAISRFVSSSSRRQPISQLRAIELAIPSPTRQAASTLRWLYAVLPIGVLTSVDTSSSKCAGKKDNDDNDNLSFDLSKIQASVEKAFEHLPTSFDQAQNHVSFLGENAGQISWGFGLGACSGFTLKKVSKVAAFVVGLAFVGMQCASYNGYVNVNYEKLQRDIMALLDTNKDGKINSEDVKNAYDQVLKVLEYSLPAGSGFAMGFIVGFRAA